MKESLDKALRDENKPWTKMFAVAEAQTGFDRLYIAMGNKNSLIPRYQHNCDKVYYLDHIP